MEKTVFRKFPIDDQAMNNLLIRQNEKTIVVYLQLHGERRSRKIGVVTKSTRTLSVRREREQHLFRKGNAYGFNEYVIRNQTSFTHISLFDGVEHWKIPVEFILSNGTYLNFKEKGYERQLFVTLEQIEKFKIKPTELRRF